MNNTVNVFSIENFVNKADTFENFLFAEGDLEQEDTTFLYRNAGGTYNTMDHEDKDTIEFFDFILSIQHWMMNNETGFVVTSTSTKEVKELFKDYVQVWVGNNTARIVLPAAFIEDLFKGNI